MTRAYALALATAFGAGSTHVLAKRTSARHARRSRLTLLPFQTIWCTGCMAAYERRFHPSVAPREAKAGGDRGVATATQSREAARAGGEIATPPELHPALTVRNATTGGRLPSTRVGPRHRQPPSGLLGTSIRTPPFAAAMIDKENFQAHWGRLKSPPRTPMSLPRAPSGNV